MKTELLILLIIVLYFGLLLCISAITGRKNDGNNAFFLGNRKSPWYVVAFGMIGTSISGVTFVSVPGMVESIGFTYLQMCMGFVVGYVLIAYVLLPVYFKLHLTTIYEYLQKRLGKNSYRTGAGFFLLSKITGAAARLYIVVMLLHTFVFDKFDVPFPVTVGGIIFLIWLYTFKSGIKTIIWTDSLQTLVLLTALILILTNTCRELGYSLTDAARAVAAESELSRIFVFDARPESRVMPGDVIVESVPAYNTTPGREKFHPKGNGNGYVLTLDGLRIYIAGDTEDIPEMADLKDIDVAFLPVNQPYTMTPDQSVHAAQIVRPKTLIPYHFGETDLGDLPERLPGVRVLLRQMQ